MTFAPDIRRAVRGRLRVEEYCMEECLNECGCWDMSSYGLLTDVKEYWEHHVLYPTNLEIVEVIVTMMQEGLLRVSGIGCTSHCGEPSECEIPCAVYRWVGIPTPFKGTEDNPIPVLGFCARRVIGPERWAAPRWSPPGERLTMDIRGPKFTPRTTPEQWSAFYNDMEQLPKFDRTTYKWGA